MAAQPLYPFSTAEKFNALKLIRSYILAKRNTTSYPIRVYNNSLELWVHLYYVAPKMFSADKLIVTIGEIDKQMDVYKVDDYQAVYDKTTSAGTTSSVLMLAKNPFVSDASLNFAANQFRYIGRYAYEKLDESFLKKV